MRYFQSAEQVLYSVPTLERAMDNMRRRKELLEWHGVPELDLSKPYISIKGLCSALDEALALPEVERNLAYTEDELKKIYGIISRLEDKQRKVLELWYIERVDEQKIAAALGYTSATSVYNVRNKAVANFALEYYGVGL